MIILIGNQKGGVGKSTVCLLLANFLSQEKSCSLTLFDMDFQRSLSQKHAKSHQAGNSEPYKIIYASAEQFNLLKDAFQEDPQNLILIDFAGRVEDMRLLPAYQAAELVICPFSYEEMTINSTLVFAAALTKINPGLQFIFIPNRIKANVGLQIQQKVDKLLLGYGMITSPIPDRVEFQRIPIYYTPKHVQLLTYPILEQIAARHFLDQRGFE